jgi:HD-GYP domain-containing protein (c-di-GMP phosphodiesterase class II)
MDISNLREQVLNPNLKVLLRPTPQQADSPYLPINVKALMAEERLTFSVHLKVSEGEAGEIKFLPYLEEGEVLQGSWLESLKRVGIERLYVHEQHMDRIVAYLNNHLLLLSSDLEHRQEKFCILREHLTVSLHRAFKNPQLGGHVTLAKKSLGNLATFMGGEDFPWKLVWDMLYRDYTLYNHSVNVGLMGMALLIFLGKPQRDCLNIGLAGLFHDLGLTCLNEEIVLKTLPLDPDEREILNRHPLLGYRLLQNNPQIPIDTLRLILEHHENADGSGYPEGLPLSRQHPHTRLLFILEVYDGLTTFRPYRPAHTPFAALKILQEQRGAQGLACEPRTLKQFIQFLALA